MNYTKPNDPDHVDKPTDWLNSALIFGRALGCLLEEGTGIVIDLKGDMFNPMGESKRVVVFYKEGQIMIDDFEDDLPEGSLCRIVYPEDN